MLIEKIKKNTFLKHVLTLMTGTAIAQALNIIIAPVLSRLYDPGMFGVFAVYASIASICTVFVGLRYEYSIVLPKKREDAANVLFLSIIIVILMTTFTTCTLLLVQDYLKIIFKVNIKPLIWWIPFSVLFLGIYNCLNYWSTRNKNYKRLSISQVFRSVSVVSTQLTGGLAKVGSSGLVAGQAIGNTIATIVLGFQIWKDDRKILINSFQKKKIKKLARSYKEFPLYSAPQALVNSISQNAAPFILAAYFSPVIVGYYALSLRLLQLPLNIIGESIRQVFYQRAAEIHNSGVRLYRYLNKSTMFLAVIAFVPTLVIFIYAPQLFSLVLGSVWFEAGEYARWMMLWLAFGFMNRPAFAVAQVLGLQKLLLYYETTLLVTRVGGLFYGAYYLSPLGTIILYSVLGTLFNLLLIIGIIFLSNRITTKLN